MMYESVLESEEFRLEGLFEGHLLHSPDQGLANLRHSELCTV